MLVKLERTPEATAYAVKSFKRPDEALVLPRRPAKRRRMTMLKIADVALLFARDDENEMEGSSVVPLGTSAARLRRRHRQDGGRSEGRRGWHSTFRWSLEAFRAVQTWAGTSIGTRSRKDLLARLARAPTCR